MKYGTKEETAKASCLECGDEIKYGRTDRKFCCEACKNKYNNRKARDSRVTKLRVIHSLERNHEILDKMISLGVESMDLAELKNLGFDADYVTSYKKIRSRCEFSCFDIKFILTPTKICSISKMSATLTSLGEAKKQ